MSTVTARAIKRRNSNRPQSSLVGFLAFLKARGVSAHYTGRKPAGSRTMFSSASFGRFTSVSFRHPTKKATPGRYSSLAFARPEIAA